MDRKMKLHHFERLRYHQIQLPFHPHNRSLLQGLCLRFVLQDYIDNLNLSDISLQFHLKIQGFINRILNEEIFNREISQAEKLLHIYLFERESAFEKQVQAKSRLLNAKLTTKKDEEVRRVMDETIIDKAKKTPK